jgi:hypothetical protein
MSPKTHCGALPKNLTFTVARHLIDPRAMRVNGSSGYERLSMALQERPVFAHLKFFCDSLWFLRNPANTRKSVKA